MTKLTKSMRVKCIIHTGAEMPSLNIKRFDTAEMFVLKALKALDRLEKKTVNYLAATP